MGLKKFLVFIQLLAVIHQPVSANVGYYNTNGDLQANVNIEDKPTASEGTQQPQALYYLVTSKSEYGEKTPVCKFPVSRNYLPRFLGIDESVKFDLNQIYPEIPLCDGEVNQMVSAHAHNLVNPNEAQIASTAAAMVVTCGLGSVLGMYYGYKALKNGTEKSKNDLGHVNQNVINDQLKEGATTNAAIDGAAGLMVGNSQVATRPLIGGGSMNHGSAYGYQVTGRGWAPIAYTLVALTCGFIGFLGGQKLYLEYGVTNQ